MKDRKGFSIATLFLALLLFAGIASSQMYAVPKDGGADKAELLASDYTKPGGIVIGPAYGRGLIYGGRNSARDSEGMLHFVWGFTRPIAYYTHSLDTLGLTWETPIDVAQTVGFEGYQRCYVPHLWIDQTNDDIYILAQIMNADGVFSLSLTRSTDNGVTWTPFQEVRDEVGFSDVEFAWGTFMIDSDRILHLAAARADQDIYYTRCDVSAADGEPNLDNLVWTKADGVTPGAEAVSFVPSGVVFQGTVVVDRNNDPHIIFSGDGSVGSFGDKTPYHIYYKSEASAWGPIPPTRLQADLSQVWGIPEMVFDKNNRGHYFLDGLPGVGIGYGTWEPPVDATSANDFGTLNNGQGFEGSVALISDNYPDVPMTTDESTFLPNADVDDANDVVYVVFTNSDFQENANQGGDIVALKLENASTYEGSNPADMPWELHRWITRDGPAPLGDMSPDVVYDPSSAHLDIFWAGAGPGNGLAQYLDGTAPIPAKDIKPQALDYGLTVDNPINKNETITITGTFKNNGTDPLPPVAATLTITDSSGAVLLTATQQIPPMLPDLVSPALSFGDWTVPGDLQEYTLTMQTALAGDEADYNDVVTSVFFAYPALDEAVFVETFQDSTYESFPTTSAKGTYYDGAYAGGWTVYDSLDAEEADYLSTIFLDDADVDNDIGAYIRHMIGVRNDTIYGDMPDGTPPYNQNELLYSPVIDISGVDFENNILTMEFNYMVDGTDDDDNFPIYAWVDISTDGGATWQEVLHLDREAGGANNSLRTSGILYFSDDITDMVAGSSEVQMRFWWRNLNNTSEFATWFIDNVYLVQRPATAVEDNDTKVAATYALSQNYPNPFNPTTEISYTLPKASKATLVVYNVMGQEVAQLVNAKVSAGTHSVRFDASHLPTGVYFYKLQADGFESVKKMALMK